MSSLRSKYESEVEKSSELGAQVARMDQVLSTSREALTQEQKTVELLKEQQAAAAASKKVGGSHRKDKKNAFLNKHENGESSLTNACREPDAVVTNGFFLISDKNEVFRYFIAQVFLGALM